MKLALQLGLLVQLSLLSYARGEQSLEWLYKQQTLDDWQQQLEAEQPNDRKQAIRAVASFASDEPKRVKSLLVGMLDDSDRDVRRGAVRNLETLRGQTEIDEAEIIGILSSILLDSEQDRSTRITAASTLSHFRVAGANALVAGIPKIADMNVRDEAYEELSLIPSDIYREVSSSYAVQLAMLKLPLEQTKEADYAERIAMAIERIENADSKAEAESLIRVANEVSTIAGRFLAAEVSSADASIEIRTLATHHLGHLPHRPPRKDVLEAVGKMLSAEQEGASLGAALLLAAIDPDSEAGDRALDIIADSLIAESKGQDIYSMPLFYHYRLTTSPVKRLDDLYARVADRCDDEQTLETIRQMRYGVAKYTEVLSAELLEGYLDSELVSIRIAAAQKLADIDPKYKKQAADTVISILQSLPEDDDEAKSLAKGVVTVLKEIDHKGKLAPEFNVDLFVRLTKLAVGHPWNLEQQANQRQIAVDALVQQIASLPKQNQPTRFERNPAGKETAAQFCFALSRLGEDGLAALKQIVIDYHQDYRGRAAAETFRRVEPKGTQALIELAQHEVIGVRKCALADLSWRIPGEGAPDEKVLALLIENCRSENVDIQWYSLSGLGRVDCTKLNDDQLEQISDVLIKSFRSTNERIAKQAVTGLRRLAAVRPQPVVAEFRKALRTWEPHKGYQLLFALALIGADSAAALPELQEFIKNNEKGQHYAIVAIRSMGPAARPAIPLLIELLDSPNLDDRLQAAIALSQSKEHVERAIPVLIDVMKNGKPTAAHFGRDPRILAMEALGELGPKAAPAIDDLLELVERLSTTAVQKNPMEYRIVQAAVAALGKIGLERERVVSVLRELLNRHRHDSNGVALLIEAMNVLKGYNDSAATATDGLVQCLRQQGSRETAREMLLSIGEPAIPALVEALHGDKKLAIPAAEVLAEMGPRAASAVPDLIDVVRDRGAPTELRIAAIEALAATGESAQQAVPYLRYLAQESPGNDTWLRKLSAVAKQALDSLEEPTRRIE